MRKMFVLTLLVGLGFLAWGAPQEIPLPGGATALDFAWAPDGSGVVVLYSGGEGTAAEWLELPDGRSRWRATGLDLSLQSHPLAFSPDGEELAVGEWHRVRFLAASNGATLRTIELEERFRPLSLVCRPDGSLAVVLLEMKGYGDLYLEIWNRAGRLEERIELGKRASQRPKADFSSDGRLLAYAAGTEEEPGGEAWLLHLFDLESGSVRTLDLREIVPELPWEEQGVQIAGLAIRPDGRELAVGLYSADAGRPLVLRLGTETGGLIGRLFPVEWERYMVEELSYTTDGSFLTFSGYSARPSVLFSTLAIVDLLQEEPEVTLLCQSEPQDVRECPSRSPHFSPDGRTLVGLWQDAVCLWDLCLDFSQLPAPEWTFFFSSGGAYHPSGHGEWRVRLAPSGELTLTHKRGEEAEDFGPFRLDPAENESVWALIQALDIPCRASSLRLGIPDEALISFSLKGTDQEFRLELWEGDAWDDPQAAALLGELSRLIEAWTGLKPVL